MLVLWCLRLVVCFVGAVFLFCCLDCLVERAVVLLVCFAFNLLLGLLA